MALEDIDPQFRMDAAVAPTFKCENYNPEDKTFEVFFNDGTCLLYTSDAADEE